MSSIVLRANIGTNDGLWMGAVESNSDQFLAHQRTLFSAFFSTVMIAEQHLIRAFFDTCSIELTQSEQSTLNLLHMAAVEFGMYCILTDVRARGSAVIGARMSTWQQHAALLIALCHLDSAAWRRDSMSALEDYFDKEHTRAAVFVASFRALVIENRVRASLHALVLARPQVFYLYVRVTLSFAHVPAIFLNVAQLHTASFWSQLREVLRLIDGRSVSMGNAFQRQLIADQAFLGQLFDDLAPKMTLFLKVCSVSNDVHSVLRSGECDADTIGDGEESDSRV